MPFTAPVLDIGSGLANGIMTGADSLNKAIQYVGDQYVNSKAAEGTAQYLAKSGAMSRDELNEFMGKSLGAKQQILGMKMAQFMHGVDLNNQMALQNNQSSNVIGQQQNQGQVNVQTNRADMQNQLDFYKKYGYMPGRSPDQMPAPPANPNAGQVPGDNTSGTHSGTQGQVVGDVNPDGSPRNIAAPTPSAPATPSVPMQPDLPVKMIPGVGPVQVVPGSGGKGFSGYINPKTGQFVPMS